MHSRAARSVSIPLETPSANAGDGMERAPNCSQPVLDEDEDLPIPSLESRWLAMALLVGLTVINVMLQSPELNFEC
jgi:hypothetical protein